MPIDHCLLPKHEQGPQVWVGRRTAEVLGEQLPKSGQHREHGPIYIYIYIYIYEYIYTYIPIQYISPSNIYPHPIYIPTQSISPSSLYPPHPHPPIPPTGGKGKGGRDKYRRQFTKIVRENDNERKPNTNNVRLAIYSILSFCSPNT